MREWIDISLPLKTGMAVWPGDPEVRIEKVEDMAAGAPANLSQMRLSLHAGTHIDAPLHFLPEGEGIERMSPEATVGLARVIAIADPIAITATELEGHGVREGERILLRTSNSMLYRLESFASDFVGLNPEAAAFLAERKVRAVGIDYLSVGLSGHEAEVHRILLNAGIWIIEGLDLSAVSPGNYDLLCLPLLIPGAEAAPARALLRSCLE